MLLKIAAPLGQLCKVKNAVIIGCQSKHKYFSFRKEGNKPLVL